MLKLINLKLPTSILFLLLIIFACDTKPPIPEDKFLKAYVDLLIIQDTTTKAAFSIDSVKNIVFGRYNISFEQYDAMINYYNAEPEKWIEFFDSAGTYVDRLKLNAGSQL